MQKRIKEQMKHKEKHRKNIKKLENKVHEVMLLLYGSILLAVLTGNGNLFGSTTDWINQHTVFPEVFRQAFYESGQLIPNFLFDIGGGQNAFHFAYYGFLSPFILFSYLLPFVDMTVYIMALCIICYFVSGILVYQFLKHHFTENKAFCRAILFLSLPPINYHFHRHIMFVWHLPFFILALIGLDRYFEQKKRKLFVISSVCMILTSYFFSVSGLVFLFVYAIFCIIKQNTYKSEKNWICFNLFWKQILENIKLFLLPVMLSAFFLLPTAYALLKNERSHVVEEEAINLAIPLYEEYFYSPYSMGISAVLLFAVIGNLTCKTKTKAEWFLNVCSLFLLMFPFIMYVLNGMLYVRGKVLIAYSIVLLYNFCQFMEHMEKKEIRMKVAMALSIALILLFMILRTENEQIGRLLLTELAIIWLFRNRKRVWYIYPIVIACFASYAVNISETYVSVEAYKGMCDDEIAELMEHTEGNFYRSNVTYQEMNTANRVYGENFHGSCVYSSTSNSLYQKFYETYMGNNEKYRNCFVVSGARNELFYSFMGTKYMIGKNDPGLYYEKIVEGERLNLYENQYAYPVVYKSSQMMEEAQFDTMKFPYSAEALMTHTIISGEDKMERQDNRNISSGIKQCHVQENYTFMQKKKERYTIPLGDEYKNQIIYLTFDIVNEGNYRNTKDISITINGIQNKLTNAAALYYNGNTKFDYVIPMERCSELKIEITKGKYDIRNLKMYTSEMIFEKYEEADNLEIDEYSNAITCNTIAKEGEYLVTSIPYDKGFFAYINGEKVEVEVVNKAFVGIRLKEGENDIVIKYRAPFFREGMLVSLLGIFLLLFDRLSYSKKHIVKNYF